MKYILSFVLTTYILVLITLYFLQRQLLYFPSIEPEYTNYQVLTIDSGPLKIKVVVDNPNRSQAVIYFGGNGENVYNAAIRMQDAFINRAAYYVNYPGYGGSTGEPSETTITQAARDVYNYVSAKHAGTAVVGRSLGTGVAVIVAEEYRLVHLVLISPFDSVIELASTHYPLIPARWLLKDTYDSVSRAKTISSKVLVMLANDDRVIPLKHSQSLIQALQNGQRNIAAYDRVKVLTYTDADHNNLHLKPNFMQDISDFLQE